MHDPQPDRLDLRDKVIRLVQAFNWLEEAKHLDVESVRDLEYETEYQPNMDKHGSDTSSVPTSAAARSFMTSTHPACLRPPARRSRGRRGARFEVGPGQPFNRPNAHALLGRAGQLELTAGHSATMVAGR
jgi:hypothetical protein